MTGQPWPSFTATFTDNVILEHLCRLLWYLASPTAALTPYIFLMDLNQNCLATLMVATTGGLTRIEAGDYEAATLSLFRTFAGFTSTYPDTSNLFAQ